MKRSGIDHPKVKRLARCLGVRHHAAVGILEMLWHFAARTATPALPRVRRRRQPTGVIEFF